MKYFINKFKEHKLMSIIIFFLLILEAILIIMLPKIMDKSKNVLYVNSGIDSIIPNVLSVRTMNALNGINKNEELKDYYELIKKDNEKYKDQYEILKREDIYILKDDKRDNNLEKLLLKTEALYYLLLNSDELTRRGFKPDATVVNYYMGLSDDNEIKRINEAVNNMDDMKLKEYAIKFIINEYNDLRVNMEDIENDYLNKNIIICIIISIFIIMLIIINKKIPLKVFNESTSNMLNITVTGIPIILTSLINIFLVNSSKLMNACIIFVIILALTIIYKYLIKNKKIPRLKEKLINLISLLLKPLALIIMNVIFIFNLTNDITIICYLIEYTVILLMIVNYYITYKK